MTASRGAVLIESALTLTLTLLFLYGALQIGIVGLEQITVDGGAYTAAHQQALPAGKGQPGVLTPDTLARTTLTHLQSANAPIGLQTAPPPATAFNGQYNLTQTNARYGGVSMVQPVQAVATVKRLNIDSIVMGVTGSPLSVTGISVEPLYRMINPHFDVSGNAFGSVGAFNTAVDPLADNAPPYFVGFNYLQTCPFTLTSWNTCPSAPVLTALGIAEFLDADNWSRPVNGVTPDIRAVFWEMRYHQALYANISGQLNVAVGQAAKNLILDPTKGDVACVYSFDNSNPGAYSPGYVGFDPYFKLHPDGSNGATCPAP